MTRRRFQHCRNEKCNRRLEPFSPLEEGAAPPPAKLCEACLELESRTEASSYQRGFEDGERVALGRGTLRGLIVGAGLAGLLWIGVEWGARWILG